MSEGILQPGAGVRFEWGPVGADRLVREAACLVVVDVLSFSMAVSVAVEKGTRVLPFWSPQQPTAATEEAALEEARGLRPAVRRPAGGPPHRRHT